eukprot:6213311-Pleurochrysis_carterae.AAC.6
MSYSASCFLQYSISISATPRTFEASAFELHRVLVFIPHLGRRFRATSKAGRDGFQTRNFCNFKSVLLMLSALFLCAQKGGGMFIGAYPTSSRPALINSLLIDCAASGFIDTVRAFPPPQRGVGCTK